MLFSKTCEYAIRASVLLAAKELHEQRKYVPVRELSQKLNISFHFLTKICQSLTEARILHSSRGPAGGVGLARPAEHIRLIEILAATDGIQKLVGCVLGLPGCNDERPCPLHTLWGAKRDQIQSMLEQTTLADLSSDGKRSPKKTRVDKLIKVQS